MIPTMIDAVSMVEQDRNLYLVDSLQGIFKFDLFGFYNTTFHFNTKEVQCFNQDIVFMQQGVLTSYNTQTIQEKKQTLTDSSNILQVRIERNKLYVRKKNQIEIYNQL